MIQTILWDVDGTLLDFLAAEEAAIRKLFVEFDMGECSDEMLARYSKINRSYWERLERNEITKQQVLVGRFEEFFASEGLDAGVAEQFNAYGRVDIFTGTLGKAFGGAMGGFTTGKKEIIDMLRQRSRPYLFSNSVAPAIIGASLEMFKILKESDALHTKLMDNVNYFRDRMLAAGFDIKPTQSAICAVMLYDAKLSQDFAAKMQKEGIYVTGFYYPVVPKGQARIRVQLSAGHEKAHLDKAIAAFIKVGKELGVIK